MPPGRQAEEQRAREGREGSPPLRSSGAVPSADEWECQSVPGTVDCDRSVPAGRPARTGGRDRNGWAGRGHDAFRRSRAIKSATT